MHDPVSFGVALVRSGDKMATLFEVVAAAGLICFRLVADTLTLLDLYQRTDIRAFSIKLTMIGLAASWAAMWVYPQTPTNWMYMPPLALQSGQLMCLPCCMALLTFFQLLPACILLLCFILLAFSDTAEEVERAMDMLRLPQVFEALQRASLLTETVPVFFLNIFLLAGPELSPTSWSFLYISTLIDGCFLVKTFAQIDCFGHVSHFVRTPVFGGCCHFGEEADLERDELQNANTDACYILLLVCVLRGIRCRTTDTRRHFSQTSHLSLALGCLMLFSLR